jgi:hypothetical protein
MLTEFPGVLLWMVPGAIVWLAGLILIFRAVVHRGERSPRGFRVHLIGMAMMMLGLAVGGVSAAVVHGSWVLVPVIASIFLPIALFFAVLSTQDGSA